VSDGPRLTDSDGNEPIDPDLVRLGRRIPIGPLLAASVLGFAVLLMVRLRHDLVFSARGETPTQLAYTDDSYVSVSAVLDARAPARLRGLQSAGRRLTPVLGSRNRLWISEPGEANSVAPSYDGRFTGWLRRLDDTSFGDDLRAFVAELPPLPRVVDPASLGPTGLPEGETHGDLIHVTPETRVTVRARVPDAALVTVVKTDGIADEPSARRALEAAGLGGRAVARTAAGWTYELAIDPAAASEKLRAARLFAAAAEPKEVTHEGRAAELRVDAETLTLGAQVIPRASVTLVTAYTPSSIPADAWVLSSGDTPAGLWYMRPVYGLLALIGLLMVWALVVDLRHMRKQRADSTV
jgi:hypothetical protein